MSDFDVFVAPLRPTIADDSAMNRPFFSALYRQKGEYSWRSLRFQSPLLWITLWIVVDKLWNSTVFGGCHATPSPDNFVIFGRLLSSCCNLSTVIHCFFARLWISPPVFRDFVRYPPAFPQSSFFWERPPKEFCIISASKKQGQSFFALTLLFGCVFFTLY